MQICSLFYLQFGKTEEVTDKTELVFLVTQSLVAKLPYVYIIPLFKVQYICISITSIATSLGIRMKVHVHARICNKCFSML